MCPKALIVDNNPVHLRAVASFLEKEGCQITTAINGLEAIEKIQVEKPDILFTDLIMPLVDGEKLCKIVRGVEEYSSIFIVVISAILLEDRERILTEIECDVSIDKGTLAEINQNLKKALHLYREKELASDRILVEGGKDSSYRQPVTQELLKEIKHIRRLLENISDGIIELSVGGRVVSINEAGTKIWDITKEEIIGQELEILPFGKHRGVIQSWRLNQLGKKDGEILEIFDDDPLEVNEKILTASLIPVHRSDSQFAVCMFRDITRQYLAEKKKEEIDNGIKLIKRMEAMSFMAGGVAHDFNNLLTVICGNLDLLAADEGKNDKKRDKELLNKAKNSAYSAVELVRKISNVSPYGIIRRKDIRLESLIERVCGAFFKDRQKQDYTCITKTDQNFVNIDETQVQRAIYNVLQNAVESGNKETISIIIDRERISSPTIKQGQYLSPGNYAKVAILDKGRGIPKSNLHEIFDPYFSTKQRSSLKGMGLGLTIVFSTLRNHGGYVIVESEEGLGTCASLYFPISKMDKKTRTDLPINSSILVVERDSELRSISKNMLEYLKYEVCTAKNSFEAFEIVEKRCLQDNRLTIAFVNLSEGGEYIGIDQCKGLLKLDASLQVVVCSGATFDPVMLDYKKYGFSAAMAKPYTIEEFKKVISGLSG